MESLIKKCIKTMILVIIIVGVISACDVKPPKYQTSVQQMHASLREAIAIDKSFNQAHHSQPGVPHFVNDALLPQIHAAGYQPENRISEHRFNVAADRMPARTFFAGLVDGTPYNMIVSPDINGNITLNLKNVTLLETMNAVRDMYGYDYRRTTYGFEVSPPELETQIFTVNYLDVKRKGQSTTAMTSGQITNSIGTVSAGGGGSSSGSNAPAGGPAVGTEAPTSSSTVDTTSEVNFWKDLEKTLKNMVPEDKAHGVVINSQAGLVIMRAYPIELHRIGRYLARIQANLQRQIIIEAKILEIRLADNFESGIDWSLLGNPLSDEAGLSQSGNGPNSSGASGAGAFANTALQSFDPIFTINIKGSFRTLMNFLQTQGNVQTLSSPRISTVNNQKAVIKVGQDEFFVTGVSTTNSVVGTNTLPSQNVNLTPFFSGITLDVTPQISKNGTVILHIHPSVSLVTEQQKTIVLGSTGSAANTLSLPLALSTIRESDNIVRAKSGQVVVIGGLMENDTSETIGGTPLLSRIPFIGALFRRTSQASAKNELVILLRPILVNNKVWEESLEHAACEVEKDTRDFHVGGLVDVFGDKGEVTDANYG